MMNKSRTSNRYSAEGAGLWTATEHQRFLQALKVYPNGPWRAVSEFVGTRNVRQTMTHAQKYKQKIARHERGLRTRRQNQKHSSSSDEDDDQDEAEAKPMALLQPLAYPTTSSGQHAVQMLDFRNMNMNFESTSYAGMLQDSIVSDSVAALAAPLTFTQPSLDIEHFVLATPVVSDCLDYLVRSFA